MPEWTLIALTLGPLLVGCFALTAALLALVVSLTPAHRGERFAALRLFAAASTLTAVYLLAESTAYGGFLTGRPGWSMLGYRLMLASALLGGVAYWLLVRRLIGAPGGNRLARPAFVIPGVVLFALAALLPAPYGLFLDFRVNTAQGLIAPYSGVGAVVYGALGGALITYLAWAAVRRLWRRRRGPWPVLPTAGLIACLTAYHDLFRLLGLRLAGPPLLWLGFGILLVSTFVYLGKQYAGLVLRLEGREAEVRRLRKGQMVDPASGTYTRGMLEQLLGVEIQRLARGQGPGSGVLVADLPGYSELIPRLGRTDAETVLREIAETVRGCIREEDTVGRWSSGRFVILLHTPDAERARLIVERIQRAVADTHLPIAAGLNLQLKMGYAQIHADRDRHWEHVVRKAEQAAQP